MITADQAENHKQAATQKKNCWIHQSIDCIWQPMNQKKEI